MYKFLKLLFFIFLIIISLVLSLATIILHERFYLSLFLLFVFSIFLIIFLYFNFYLKIKNLLKSFSIRKIIKALKILFLIIITFVFIFYLFNLKIFNDKKIVISKEINKDFISFIDNVQIELIYIKDEKYNLIKNYLEELKLLLKGLKYTIIDPVFDFELYKKINQNFSSTLSKGSLVVKIEDKYSLINNINIKNIVFSILSLIEGKKKICVIGDDTKSIYNFNEYGLAVFSSVIEDAGFDVLEFNFEVCDLCLIFNTSSDKYNLIKENENKIYILKDLKLDDFEFMESITPSLRELVDYNFYAKNLISKFSEYSFFNKLSEEVIAGEAYKIKGKNFISIAYTKDAENKEHPIMISYKNNIYISAPNILSNLYMKNQGNQDFAKYLIYSYFESYTAILNKNTNNSMSFFTSFRFLKYIKILLFIISPVLILLSGIMILKKEFFNND